VTPTTATTGLRRVLTRKDVLALSFGAMVGWGWVILTGEWLLRGGSLGAVLGFLCAGVVMVWIGLVYAELAAAMPVVGGEHAYSLRALGARWSFLCTWAIVFVYASVCAFEAVALPTVIEYWFPDYRKGHLWTVAGWDVHLSWTAVGVAGAVAVTAVNYVGVRFAAVVQTVVTLAIGAAGLLLVSGAAFAGPAADPVPLFSDGLSGVLLVAVMAPFMFVGFDVIPQAAEEIALPPEAIGRLIAFSIVLAVTWYGLVVTGVAALSGPADLAAATLTTAEAAARAWGPWGGHLLVLGGVAGIVTSWNAFMLGGSRALYAMAESGMLPGWLAAVHPRYGTPHRTVLTIGALSMLAPFFGRRALVWIVDAGSFAVVVAYVLVAASFLRLRRREPDMPRPFRAPLGRAMGILALCGSLGLAVLYLPGSPSALAWPVEWLLVGGWFALGGCLYAVAARRGAVDGPFAAGRSR
jgi:amino acid transporter